MKTLTRDDVPDDLIKLAIAARQVADRAHNPFSGGFVGAAIQSKSGRIYQGTFFESASGPAGVCAERVAIGRAITEGESQFKAIAVVGGDKEKKYGKVTTPCGVCRQILAEFGSIVVICSNMSLDRFIINTSIELIPDHFEKS